MNSFGLEILKLAYTTGRHQDWLAMAMKLGAGDFAEDIVQEMYLKLGELKRPERVMFNENQINGFYVYVIIKNLVYDLQKAQTKYTMVSLDDVMNVQYEPYDPDTDNDFEEKLQAVQREIAEWYWYDRMMFKIYHNTDLSIRKLSEETNISASSIFNTLKTCKNKIVRAHKRNSNG